MNNYDLDINNYNEQELCGFLRINEDLSTLSSSSVIKYVQHFKKSVQSKSISDGQKEVFIVFMDKAKQKLLSYIEKRPPVQLPPTNYNIIQSQNQLSGGTHAVTTDKIVPVVNTFDDKYPAGVINPIERKYFTKVISIDSLFRKNYDTTNSNSFYWTLPKTEHKVVSMKLVSVELPISWHSISETLKNNVFKIKLYNVYGHPDSEQIITIPPGNYNYIEFFTALNNLFLNTGNGLEFLICDISNVTAKTVIRARDINDFGLKPYDITAVHYSPDFYYEVIFDMDSTKCNSKEKNKDFQKSLGWFLGFRKSRYTVKRLDRYVDYAGSNTGLVTYESYLCSESSYGSGRSTYIYLAIDDFNKNSLAETISSSVGDVFIGNDILGRLSIENSANEIMIHQNDKVFSQRDYLGPITLRKLNIKLLNRFGDPIDINNNDFSFALELKVLY
jgi:hypothetical protein